MTKKKISERQIYDLIASIDSGGAELEELEVPVLEAAMVAGFIRPSRFRTVRGKRVIAAYETTPEGREFVNRIDDEYEKNIV